MCEVHYQGIFTNTGVPVAFGSQYNVLVAPILYTWLKFKSLML